MGKLQAAHWLLSVLPWVVALVALEKLEEISETSYH